MMTKEFNRLLHAAKQVEVLVWDDLGNQMVRSKRKFVLPDY